MNEVILPPAQTAGSALDLMFEGNMVRAIIIDGEPRFVGKDVAQRLGYADPTSAIKQHCKGVVQRHPLVTPGGIQEVRVLAEPDVLRLIVRSKLSEAVRFEKWLFEEVLPSIRKTGGYMIAAPEETAEELALRALKVLQATVERQKALLAVTEPKAEALDRIATADGSLCLTDAAKALQVRPKELIDHLKRKAWIYRRVGTDHWVGYQSRINAGDLEHKVSTVERPDGSERIREQVRVTPRGLAKLSKMFGGAADHA